MSRVFGSLSGDLKAHDDLIFDNTAIASATTGTTSDAFPWGGVQGGIELVVDVAGTAYATAQATLTVTLAQDDDPDGAFTDSKPIATFALAASASGRETFNRIIPASDAKKYAKVTVATAASGSMTGTVNAYLRQILS